MTQSADILFKLLRMVLGTDAPSSVIRHLSSEVDWPTVFGVAKKQQVEAIVADALIPLSPLTLSLDDLYDLKGGRMLCELEYEEYTDALMNLIELAKSNNIPLLLLKGYGLSRNYPVPEHRMMGDIDVMPIGENMWNRLNEVIRQRGIEVEMTTEKHSTFRWGNFTVENHKRLLDGFSFKAEEEAEKIINFDFNANYNDNGLGFVVLKPTENWLYLICHMAQHFCADGEMSVRQFLDLALHLDKNRNDIDVGRCKKWMSRTGYQKINDLFVSLAMDMTGMDLRNFIFESPSEEEKRKVLNVVMDKDRKLDFPEGKLARVGFKYRKMMNNRWKYKYVPMTFLERVMTSVRFHVKNPEEV